MRSAASARERKQCLRSASLTPQQSLWLRQAGDGLLDSQVADRVGLQCGHRSAHVGIFDAPRSQPRLDGGSVLAGPPQRRIHPQHLQAATLRLLVDAPDIVVVDRNALDLGGRFGCRVTRDSRRMGGAAGGSKHGQDSGGTKTRRHDRGSVCGGSRRNLPPGSAIHPLPAARQPSVGSPGTIRRMAPLPIVPSSASTAVA